MASQKQKPQTAKRTGTAQPLGKNRKPGRPSLGGKSAAKTTPNKRRSIGGESPPSRPSFPPSPLESAFPSLVDIGEGTVVDGCQGCCRLQYTDMIRGRRDTHPQTQTLQTRHSRPARNSPLPTQHRPPPPQTPLLTPCELPLPLPSPPPPPPFPQTTNKHPPTNPPL